MATNGDDTAAQHLQLKKVMGPNMAYLCTALEIGVLKAFIDWKVFDHIPDQGSISSASLAAKIGGEQELLDRTLPLLTLQGILEAPQAPAQAGHVAVAHTERSRLYRSGELGAGFLLHMHNCFVRSVAHFPAFLQVHGFGSPRDGTVTPLGMATGKAGTMYDIVGADPKFSDEFDSFVARTSKVFPMHGVYDLSWMQKQADCTSKEGRRLFVDMGGSNGHAVRDILHDHAWLPAERCAVFDRAPTIEHTRAELDEGIRGIQLVAGSVLETLPPAVRGALVYQFRRILNDFPDDDVRRCWKAVREAAAADTRVYVVEELLQANRNAYAVAQDVAMMLVGGKRRNADMHAALAAEVGFRLHGTFPDTHNDCTVLEFVLL
ncbi:S-adenosyl-L-methionine-dependent methyltransferase [Byssothecium circinans]|uniref:S-adenosyl-L-methionine-dependent methyltransferase n=1 Tax=Byssothecium circinans TaxID=147558 RepID=A0A6A5TY68_9PLEO|nr:S-adenosyl-L-methionine-dependent methyltransferase [Byssothecium circinans]